MSPPSCSPELSLGFLVIFFFLGHCDNALSIRDNENELGGVGCSCKDS